MFFQPEQFVDTKFDTAKDKAEFANRFRLFVTNDFDMVYFTKAFYRRLSGTFGHIAHYDLMGFWNEFFTNTADKLEFLKRTRDHSVYGDPRHTYSDVETVLKRWLKENVLIQKYTERLRIESESSERETLAKLLKKYPEYASDTRLEEENRAAERGDKF